MTSTTATTGASEVRVPDIGSFTGVPIIGVHVAPGDKVNGEDPLLTLESDKATLDVPAPSAGTVGEVLVKVGAAAHRGGFFEDLLPGHHRLTSGDAAQRRSSGSAGATVRGVRAVSWCGQPVRLAASSAPDVLAPPATRELRGWVRHRAKLVGLRSNLKCQVHAVLAAGGVQVEVGAGGRG